MIVIGTTIPPYKYDHALQVSSWLVNARAMAALSDVTFFAALEIDARGPDVHASVLRELKALPSATWTFSLDDHALCLDSNNRLARICTGRNLITQYAHDVGASHILFLDSDITVPAITLQRLLEVDWPIVGGHVPTYCLKGPRVRCARIDTDGDDAWAIEVDGMRRQTTSRPLFSGDIDLQEHMNTAGFLLVRRDLFRVLRWRWDKDAGLTDDPCYHADATRLGYPTWVRHDVIGRHWPPAIGPVEKRGHDMQIYREPALVQAAP